VLVANQADRALLVDIISLIITQSCQYDELNSHLNDEQQRHREIAYIIAIGFIAMGAGL